MNADEILGAMRACNKPKGHRCSECPVFGRYKHSVCKSVVDRAAADLIESLQAQLTASQARERAAVACINECYSHLDYDYCGSCKTINEVIESCRYGLQQGGDAE